MLDEVTRYAVTCVDCMLGVPFYAWKVWEWVGYVVTLVEDDEESEASGFEMRCLCVCVEEDMKRGDLLIKPFETVCVLERTI